MVDTSLIKLFAGFILFAVFIAMVLTFANGLGNNYGTNVDEMSGGALNVSKYYDSIENLSIEAEGYRRRFESGDVEDIDDAKGIFSVANDMKQMTSGAYTLLTQTLSNILHVPTIAINVILGFLLSLAFIFATWRLIKLGY